MKTLIVAFAFTIASCAASVESDPPPDASSRGTSSGPDTATCDHDCSCLGSGHPCCCDPPPDGGH